MALTMEAIASNKVEVEVLIITALFTGNNIHVSETWNWLGRVLPVVMQHRLTLWTSTDVSQEHIASIFRDDD
jgi:hypothetical protein